MVKKRFISSKKKKKNQKTKGKVHPWFVTGYTDGEGSFSISLFGFQISMVYSIGAEVNPLNLELLEQIKEYFGGVGSISKSGNMYMYEISSIKSLLSVRKHFEEYPLQTTKYVHFILWCQVMDIIEKKEHLTELGFNKVLSIKSVFPRGLSAKFLEVYFKGKFLPIVKPVFEPSVLNLNPN